MKSEESIMSRFMYSRDVAFEYYKVRGIQLEAWAMHRKV